MRCWRICSKRYARHALDGEGARLYGGRWNHPGQAVVYASATLSLAMLELLVHVTERTLPVDMVAIGIEFPESLPIARIEVRQLPRGWRTYPASDLTRDLGNGWLREAKTAVLCVPSAVVPRESNYLLNPAHADFARLHIGKPEAMPLDPRLTRRPAGA